jgi:hypothetical protein
MVASVLDMKPPNRIEGRLTFPARADHILKRIKIVTRELEAIQADICAGMGAGRINDPKLREGSVGARVLSEFKAA